MQEVAFKSGHLREAVTIGQAIHREVANSDTAFIIALAHAELGEGKPAIGWLRTAIDEGLEQPMQALQNPHLDSIRSNPDFVNLLSSLKN